MSNAQVTESQIWRDLHWNQYGQSSFSGGMLRLYRYIDAFFAGWADEIGASEYFFPSFLDAAQLNKVGYFQAFPHLVTLPVSLDRDKSNLDDFAQSQCLDGAGNLRMPAVAPIGQVLTPAACYHFYIDLQGSKLESSRLLTTCSRCFRREEFYEPLTRQSNFSMREMVCIGSIDDVQANLNRWRDQLGRLCDQIGLPVRFEQATDPFFNPSMNPGYVMQKLAPLKTEVMYEDVAIASLNLHHDHFGRAFDIKFGDQPASSACVAFGLERWLFALASHFGDRALAVAANLAFPGLECVI
jgi:seryl-tRNA synthetase